MKKFTAKFVATSNSDLLGLQIKLNKFLNEHKNAQTFWTLALSWAMDIARDTGIPARIEIEFDDGKGEISKFSSAQKKELEFSPYLEFTYSWEKR